jgi:hypothetical protein
VHWSNDIEMGKLEVLREKRIPVRNIGGMILKWDSGITERETCPVRSTGRMILRWDIGSTEREPCPNKEHWMNDIEM